MENGSRRNRSVSSENGAGKRKSNKSRTKQRSRSAGVFLPEEEEEEGEEEVGGSFPARRTKKKKKKRKKKKTTESMSVWDNIDPWDRNQVREKREEIWDGSYVTNRAKAQAERRGRKGGGVEVAEMTTRRGKS